MKTMKLTRTEPRNATPEQVELVRAAAESCRSYETRAAACLAIGIKPHRKSINAPSTMQLWLLSWLQSVGS